MSTTVALLQGAHALAAHFAGPHWLLNDDDAKAYALAVQNVARHHDIAVAQKTIDYLNLAGMVCFIEGTRLLYTRQQAQRPGRGHNGGPPMGQVFQFSPPVSQPGPPQPGPEVPPPGEGALH